MPRIEQGPDGHHIPLMCNNYVAKHPWDDSSGMVEQELLTFADVTIVPQYSEIDSRSKVDTTTEIVPGMKMKSPIVTANMDTVTGDQMAKMAAQLGGIGILHRNNTIEQQSSLVKRIKKEMQYIVLEPPEVHVSDSVGKVQAVLNEHQRGIAIVYDDNGEWQGIATPRDLRSKKDKSLPVEIVMRRKDTSDPHKVITAHKGISMESAREILDENRIQKLVLLDDDGKVSGVITSRNILEIDKYPNATLDEFGRLRVGAAIGVKSADIERAQELAKAGADIIVLDVAHGDHKKVYDILKKYGALPNMPPILVGNVANPQSVERLIAAGVRAIKVGVGPGAMCETRTVAGAGTPQWSTIIYCADMASRSNEHITIMADGGIQEPGDIPKALGAGADTVMIGTLFGGTDQSPGRVITDPRDGHRYKAVRGMSTWAVREQLVKVSGEIPAEHQNGQPMVAEEGIETRKEYRGNAIDIWHKFMGGLRSGMSYAGAENKQQFQERVLFARQSSAGRNEGKSRA